MNSNGTLGAAALAGIIGSATLAAPAAHAGNRSMSVTNEDDCTTHIVVEIDDDKVELRSEDCEVAVVRLNGEQIATIRMDGSWTEHVVERDGEPLVTFLSVEGHPGRIVASVAGERPETMWSGAPEDDSREMARFFAESARRLGQGPRGFTFAAAAPRRVMIGVTLVSPVDGELAEELAALGYDPDEVTLIQRVYDESPADKAGIESGDVIIRVNGFDEGDQATIREALKSKEPGQTLDVVAIRDGKRKAFTIELEAYDRRVFAPGGLAEVAPDVDIEVDVEELSEKVAKISQEMAALAMRLEDAGGRERMRIRREMTELGERLSEAARVMAQKRGWQIDVNEFFPHTPGAPSPRRVLGEDEAGRLVILEAPRPTAPPAPPAPFGEAVERDELERLERDVDQRFGELDRRLDRIERLLERMERRMERP